jgi:hypothetical protein
MGIGPGGTRRSAVQEEDKAQTLYELALRLRDLVNRVRRHEKLWRGPERDWNVVTAGLDMLQDTTWALETYAAEVDTLNDDKPHAYIRIFGVLNGLVIQQDAAFLLFNALGTPKATGEFKGAGAWAYSIPALAQARQLRVAGAGHPVEWGKKGDLASTFIVQHSVHSRGCQLMLRYDDGRTEWRHVDLKALVEAQHEALTEQYRLSIAELEADDEEHRMKYVSTPLTSLFRACDYWTPKVALAVYGSEPTGMGLGGLQTVEDALQAFRAALAERERPFAEPLLGLYRHAEYAVRKLREYFENENRGLDREMAEILADHLHATVEEMIVIAKEIDDEYSPSADG